MTKGTFVISTNMGFQRVDGYITEDGKHGLDKRGNAWHLTDIATGIALSPASYKTRKAAIGDIARAESVITQRACRESERYSKAVAELNKFKGVDKESEVKKMAKTNTAKAKANTTAPKRNNYKKQNEELKREIEILKKQVEELTRVEKTTIDTFDVEGYVNTRDNQHRITAELIEAIANTKGLKGVFKNSAKQVVEFSGSEWLYVSGETEADTKDRKDIFKAMGFKWSAPEKSWVLAPYPIASKKRWANKKARAMANA